MNSIVHTYNIGIGFQILDSIKNVSSWFNCRYLFIIIHGFESVPTYSPWI
ncbi:unnamed protein product [Tenebrio molitor]|nr:unnamed protein product [Tenebrio molitor]